MRARTGVDYITVGLSIYDVYLIIEKVVIGHFIDKLLFQTPKEVLTIMGETWR